MLRTSPYRRAALTVLVCLLALGICALAHQAKCSQYDSLQSTGYLAKAVKMSGDRCQTAAVVPRIATSFLPFSEPAVEAAPEPDDPRVPSTPTLDFSRTRPPPAA